MKKKEILQSFHIAHASCKTNLFTFHTGYTVILMHFPDTKLCLLMILYDSSISQREDLWKKKKVLSPEA